MPDATFACPDLTTFCRLDELGLQVLGQQFVPDRAVLACRVVEPDQWCRRCGWEGSPRNRETLAHEPLGWRPTTLVVTVHRYRYAAADSCGVRTPAGPPAHGRRCPAAHCAGPWKGCWSRT